MNIWATIVPIASGILTLAAAVALIYKAIRRFEKLSESAEARKEENTLIIEALFACLDGLVQLEANGTVTKTHDNLQKYIIKNRS